MSPNLKDFIVTGRFENVELGMSRADVRRAAGNPDEMGEISRRYRMPLIWRYGDIELHFSPDEDRLDLIFTDQFDEAPPIDRLREELGRNGVSYTEAAWPYERGGILMKASTGVEMAFGGLPETWLPSVSRRSL
jgi:hypothetical protein